MKLIPDGKGGYIEKGATEDEEDEAKRKAEEAKKAAAAAEAKAKEEEEEAKRKVEEAKKAAAKTKSEEDEEDEAKRSETKKARVDMLLTTASALTKVAEVIAKGGDLPETFMVDMVGNLEKVAGTSMSSSLLREVQALVSKLKAAPPEEDEEEKAKAKKEKELVGKVDQLSKTVAVQAALIRKMADAPGAGNGSDARDGGSGGSSEDDFAWPMDLAGADRLSKGAAEKRGVSFYD